MSVQTRSQSQTQIEQEFKIYICNGNSRGAKQILKNHPTIIISVNEEAFHMACFNGHLHIAQWVYELKPTLDISAKNEYAFKVACANGHLQVAQWLYRVKPTLDISAYNENAFRIACENGHLDVVQWLYQIKPSIDISADNEFAFRYACEKGHLKVAQWLYQIKPTLDILASNEAAFRWACAYGHLAVAQWIQSLNPNKYVILHVENNKINYRIIKTFNKSNTVLYKDQVDNCPICSETVCDIQTSCKHTFCESCIQTWFNSNQGQTCPYCRNCLSNTIFQPIMKHP